MWLAKSAPLVGIGVTGLPKSRGHDPPAPPVPTALLESTTSKDYLEGQSVVNTPVLELKKKLDLGPKIPYQALAISYDRSIKI